MRFSNFKCIERKMYGKMFTYPLLRAWLRSLIPPLNHIASSSLLFGFIIFLCLKGFNGEKFQVRFLIKLHNLLLLRIKLFSQDWIWQFIVRNRKELKQQWSHN